MLYCLGMTKPTASQLIQALELSPLPVEGGFFRRTYASSTLSAIYYLITPSDFSRFHRVSKDEIFHFYAGDAVELVQLTPSGEWLTFRMGNQLQCEDKPQVLVPAGNWQALKLISPGSWALLGATVSPAFEYSDFEIADAKLLSSTYPQHAERIPGWC